MNFKYIRESSLEKYTLQTCIITSHVKTLITFLNFMTKNKLPETSITLKKNKIKKLTQSLNIFYELEGKLA